MRQTSRPQPRGCGLFCCRRAAAPGFQGKYRCSFDAYLAFPRVSAQHETLLAESDSRPHFARIRMFAGRRRHPPRMNREMRMNKMDLIEHVAGEMEMSRAAANRAVDTIIDGITRALKKGEEVRITGFGTFTVKKRAAGKGRNPATGEAI